MFLVMHAASAVIDTNCIGKLRAQNSPYVVSLLLDWRKLQ